MANASRGLVGAAQLQSDSTRTRADRVLAAMRHFGPNGIVCQTTGALAHWLGVSTETVRRGIADLLKLGLIEPTDMRRGKARAYRIVESPQPEVESPQPSAAGLTAAGVVPNGTPAARSESHSDPLRNELASWEWTPELLAEYADKARALTLRYGGVKTSPSKLAGPGACDDCHADVEWRSRYGQFAVCRGCLGRRVTVAQKLEGQVAAASAGSRNRVKGAD